MSAAIRDGDSLTGEGEAAACGDSIFWMSCFTVPFDEGLAAGLIAGCFSREVKFVGLATGLTIRGIRGLEVEWLGLRLSDLKDFEGALLEGLLALFEDSDGCSKLLRSFFTSTLKEGLNEGDTYSG